MESILQSARFVLRPIQDNDLEALFGIWSDERVTRYMSAHFTDVEQARQMIGLLNSLPQEGAGERWAIVKKSDGVVIGTCGFHNVDQEHSRAEIGYEIGFEHWGQGVMQEALPMMLAVCFGSYRINRLQAFVDPQNNRSIRCLTSLGFNQEGILREYEFNQGRFQDLSIFSLLQSQWRKQQSS